jgi:adenosylhomocysteine nucleosidase
MLANQRTFPQGLKPDASNEASGGTTEVVPCYKTNFRSSLSADCKNVPIQNELWLVTSPKVADHAEKKRLAATYEAGLVEMEAAGVARLARMRGIPFYCIKGISDGYSDKLPDFNRFISADGQFRLARFVFFVLFRPWYWPALIRMGENSKKAARAIAVSVRDLMDKRGQTNNLNDNPNHQR